MIIMEPSQGKYVIQKEKDEYNKMNKYIVENAGDVTRDMQFVNLEEQRKGKKTVAFVAMSPTTRTKAPWDDLDIEIWSLNRAWRDQTNDSEKARGIGDRYLKRISRHFEIHPENNNIVDTKPKELHDDWLRQPHPFPIYMMDKDPRYPSSVRYPIEWAVERYGRAFTSTMAYMFPMASKLGFDRIELYGLELAYGGEYAYQLPEVCYHIGWFRGEKGSKDAVYIPTDSPVLRSLLYAYEEMYNPFLTSMEQRISTLRIGHQVIECNAFKYGGKVEAMDEIGALVPELKDSETWKELRKKYFEDFRVKELQMNSVMGEWNGLEVMKNVFWYIIPPSMGTRDIKTYPIPETPVPYQQEFPWPKEQEKEVKDVSQAE
jgi:hypothetical protein